MKRTYLTPELERCFSLKEDILMFSPPLPDDLDPAGDDIFGGEW